MIHMNTSGPSPWIARPGKSLSGQDVWPFRERVPLTGSSQAPFGATDERRLSPCMFIHFFGAGVKSSQSPRLQKPGLPSILGPSRLARAGCLSPSKLALDDNPLLLQVPCLPGD